MKLDHPCGVWSSNRPHPARHTTPRLLGSRPPAVGFGDPARRAGTGAKDRGPRWAHRSRGRSVRHHPHRDLWHKWSHTGRQDHRDGLGSVARFPTKAHYFASYSGTAPVEASSGEVVRHRLSLAGNRHLNTAPCTCGCGVPGQVGRPGRGVLPQEDSGGQVP